MAEHALKYRPDLDCRSDSDGEPWLEIEEGEFAYDIGMDGFPLHINFWAPQAGSPLHIPVAREHDAGKTWGLSGPLDKPTITPSIFINPPTGWHGFITEGIAKDA